MSKIDYAKEFPVSHKEIIKQLKNKFRFLTPPRISPKSCDIISRTTPKFGKNEANIPHKPNKRITRIYKLKDRINSAFPGKYSIKSKITSPRLKSLSWQSFFILFLNINSFLIIWRKKR